MTKNRAFTLIELVIVIGIVGMLLAISVSFLGGAKEKGTDTEKIQALSEMRKALQMFATDKGGFPSSTSTLVSNNYIGTINKNILYTGRDNSGNICSTGLCSSYHLAIVLNDSTNKVLASDSDSITAGYINGKSSNCFGGGTIDLCYDITP